MALALFALFALSACGARYHREWKDAAEAYRTAEDKPEVVGAWQGTWLSDHNAHTGDLWCLVEDIDDEEPGQDLHAFRYHATWGRFFQGGFTAEFPVVRESDSNSWRVAGESDLGPFGTFTHEGRIEGVQFEANYRAAEADHGTFTLRRPGE